MIKTEIQIVPNSKSCIIFFNGWGMDSNAILKLAISDFDVFEFHDYSELNFDETEFAKYDELYVVAWSMGVWAASKILDKCSLQFTKKVAINGTGFPMHTTLGIANSVFEGTLENWNEPVRTKFNIRMCGTRLEYQNLIEFMSQRTIENQKSELQQIYNQIVGLENQSTFSWDIAIVGEQDFIFTSENQKNYWQQKVKSITLPIPHYPFARFGSWKEIITIGE